MLQKDGPIIGPSDILLRYRLLNPKHTTDRAVIRSSEYQQTHLLRQGLMSSVERVCYQQCEWYSDPTAHNPTDYKNQEHHRW